MSLETGLSANLLLTSYLCFRAEKNVTTCIANALLLEYLSVAVLGLSAKFENYSLNIRKVLNGNVF